MVFPILLGSGKRLFTEAPDKKRLWLTDSRTVGDGIVILVFQPALNEGAVTTSLDVRVILKRGGRGCTHCG
jgi:hypothetical protein